MTAALATDLIDLKEFKRLGRSDGDNRRFQVLMRLTDKITVSEADTMEFGLRQKRPLSVREREWGQGQGAFLHAQTQESCAYFDHPLILSSIWSAEADALNYAVLVLAAMPTS